jgi:hypothetical protein
MGHSQIIREARERLGIDQWDAADYVGINVAWYFDLEGIDDELTMTISLAEFSRLCGLLHLIPFEVLGGEMPTQRIGPNELCAGILDYCGRHDWSTDDFGEHVGWDVESFMAAPLTELPKWGLDCLKDVCAPLGYNWIEAIPDPVAP